MSALKKSSQSLSYEGLLSKDLSQFSNWSCVRAGASLEPSQVIHLANLSEIRHVLQESTVSFEKELNIAAYMETHGEQFFMNPIEAILKPKSIVSEKKKSNNFLRCDFKSLSQKSEVLSKVEGELQKLRTSMSFRMDAILIADELITNAIYNAPFVNEKNLRGAVRGGKDILLPDNKSASLWVGHDESDFVICVKDQYGTLDILRLLQRVMDCYTTSVAANMNFSNAGGAGIGSFLIFNACSSYNLAVHKGVCSVVSATMPFKMSGKARQQAPKNLHLLEKKNE